MKALRKPGERWEIHTEKSGAWIRKNKRVFRADRVVLAAGAWGTQSLLHGAKASGDLPDLPDTIGRHTRTNSEAILGASAKNYVPEDDYSQGVAITSSFFPDENTHIEPVRYGAGSNAMALLQMVQTNGGKRLPRSLQALWKMLTHPWEVPRLYTLTKWSQRTVILLVMQNRNNSLNTHLRKLGPLKFLTSTQGEGEPSPTWIPEGNKAASLAAEEMSNEKSGHAIAGGGISELLNSPLTAHFLGGAAISADREGGAVDPYQRVWGYPTLSVHDGAAVAANPGVNPSLSIVALAERACALWPNKTDATDPRPGQDEQYRELSPIAPVSPVVPAGAPAALNLGMPRIKNSDH